jgi:Fe2+ or Zn2+ uptake regulation protein
MVLEILKDAKEHLDAEGIWMRAQKKDVDINLATVYRALNTLVEIGLVQNSYLGGGQKRAFYEVLSKPEHLHFACHCCGKVLELDGEGFNQVQRELERIHAIKIQAVHLKFEGLCADCARVAMNGNISQEV